MWFESRKEKQERLDEFNSLISSESMENKF